MTLTHRQVLTIGPMLLVAVCYAIAAPPQSALMSASAPEFSEDLKEHDNLTAEPLVERCKAIGERLRDMLGIDWHTIIREPFVLAGDMSENQLVDHYQQAIVPTTHALSVSYFSSEPKHPTTVVICSSDDRYREANLRLDNQERNQYSGIYLRKDRRVIVNTASGDGTLTHELTHALAHADFPTMPEWFDEGLASLHEACEFSADGLHLIGNPNWRDQLAFDALNRGELRMLEDVSSNRFGAAHRASIDYAFVRTFCLYLQQRGLLEAFYRTCRVNAQSDPTGLRSLCQVTGMARPRAIDDAFRAWLIAHHPSTP